MKKYLLILVALIGFGMSASASDSKSCPVKQDGAIIGYVTAWIDSDGNLKLSNDSKIQVTVTVKHTIPGGYSKTTETTVTLSSNTKEETVKTGLKNCEVISVKGPGCKES